jgi:hypothetical protein
MKNEGCGKMGLTCGVTNNDTEALLYLLSVNETMVVFLFNEENDHRNLNVCSTWVKRFAGHQRLVD